MKAFTALLVLASAVFANAQSQCLSVALGIPACGTSCLTSAGSAVGCAFTDFACQCSKSQQSAINSLAINCVVSACGAVTGIQVSSAALSVCACASQYGGSGGSPSKSPATTSANPTAPAGGNGGGTIGSFGSNTATVGSSSKGSTSSTGSVTVPTPTGSSSSAPSQFSDVNSVFIAILSLFGAIAALMVAL